MRFTFSRGPRMRTPSMSPILSSSAAIVAHGLRCSQARCSSSIRRRHRLRPPGRPAACRPRNAPEGPCIGPPGPSGELDHGSAEVRRWQGLQQFALAVQESDAGRTVHLVRAPCGEVDVKRVEVDLEVRYGLACVKMKIAPTSCARLMIGRDVGDGARGVAHVGDGHDLGAFGDHLVGGCPNGCGRLRSDRTI